ncbi:MAG: PIN domain-containing protein [Candidatus Dormibacteria bacterium]
MTAAELIHGVHLADGARAQQRSALVEKLLAALSALPVDLLVARASGRLSAALAAAGASVNSSNVWIGAPAIARGLEVLALDGAFDRIPGVRRASVD